jgi:hypothetical protein
MNRIKFTSKTTLKLNDVKYKGYNLGELPPRFGYIYNDTKETFGIDRWFNYKGLTWIQE